MNIRPSNQGAKHWFEDHATYLLDTTSIAAIDWGIDVAGMFPYTNDSNVDFQHANARFQAVLADYTLVASQRICLGVFLQPNYDIGNGVLMYNCSGGIWVRSAYTADNMQLAVYPVFGRIDGQAVGVGTANFADNESQNYIQLHGRSNQYWNGFFDNTIVHSFKEEVVGFFDRDLLNDVQGNIADLSVAVSWMLTTMARLDRV